MDEPAGPTLMVVEDHADSANVVARILQRSGYRVHVAATVAEARILAAQHTFDLLLCDLGLPDGDGCDLMSELRSQYNLPAIAITGHTLPIDESRVAEAGIVHHLLKPIAFDQLLTTVAAALAERNSTGRA